MAGLFDIFGPIGTGYTGPGTGPTATEDILRWLQTSPGVGRYGTGPQGPPSIQPTGPMPPVQDMGDNSVALPGQTPAPGMSPAQSLEVPASTPPPAPPPRLPSWVNPIGIGGGGGPTTPSPSGVPLPSPKPNPLVMSADQDVGAALAAPMGPTSVGGAPLGPAPGAKLVEAEKLLKEKLGTLSQALKGVTSPAAPALQKIASPAAPRPTTAIAPGLQQLLAMLNMGGRAGGPRLPTLGGR